MKTHLVLGLALAAILTVKSPQALAKSEHAPETSPQIVRLTYVDGDVRVSRGKEGGAPKDVDWEKAVADLPLEEGFSLATGDGRAEIEFEDASTLYLAPNSVLIFNDLESTGGVPRTEMALLTGTVTLGIHPDIKGEAFILRTPTDTMETAYGQKSDMRVTAYMDAIGITPLTSGFIRTTKDTIDIVRPGHTDYFRNGKRVIYTESNGENDYAAWDKWVAGRVAQRNEEIAEMLKETGLKAPIPGLAQMAGQGKFVDCPGYGTCWQPPAPSASQLKTASQKPKPAPSLLPAQTEYTLAGEPSPGPTTSPMVQGFYGAGYDAMDMFFPCGPQSIYYRLAMYSGMGMNPMGGYGYWSDPYAWDWAVCHSGSWIYQQNQYLWVPGNNRHHHAPVRWVRSGGKNGWVPIHPHDVSGKPPINRVHGIFAIDGKKGSGLERIQFNPGSEVKVLNSAPKEFRKPFAPPLARVDAPHMEAHTMRAGLEKTGIDKAGLTKSAAPAAHEIRDAIAKPGVLKDEAGKTGALRASGAGAGIPIVFDHHSQSFMMSHDVVEGRNIRTVSEPVGSYLARSGAGFGGPVGFQGAAGGYRGAGGAGVSNGGSAGFHGGGVINGGGPRGGGGGGFQGGTASRGGGGGGGSSGGGGFQGGGASHGGGGGGASPSSSSGGGGASAPSSGGNSHR